MALATLSIDLIAQLARFEQDLGKAVRLSEKAAAGVKGSFEGIGEVFAGSFLADFAAEAVRQLADLPAAIIESIAGFKDLEDKTGASAEALAKWQAVAELSGTSMEAIGDASVRLTGALSKIGEGGNIASAALAKIGINVEAFRQLAPDEQFKAVADGLAQFEDGAGKTAVAVALLGKSGAEMIPFFKDLAEAGDLQVRLTQEQIERVDQYTKIQSRLRAEFKAVAQVVVAESLPAFTALVEAGKETLKAFLGIDRATGNLDAQQVSDFADGAARALAFVVDAIDGVVRGFQLAGTFIGGAAAQAALIIKGEFRAAASVGEQVMADMRAIMDKPLFSTRFEEQLKRMRDSTEKALGDGKAKPKLEFNFDPDAEKKVKDVAKAYEDLIGEIRKRTSAAEAELGTGEKLTAGQQFSLDILAKLANAESGYSDAQKRTVTAMLEVFLGREQLLNQQREGEKLTQQATRAVAVEISQAGDLLTSLREQAEEYGKSADQVERLRQARVEETAAKAQEKLETMELMGFTKESIEQQRILVDTLREVAKARGAIVAASEKDRTDPLAGASRAVSDYLKNLESVGESTRRALGNTMATLEDDLTNALSGGKDGVRTTINAIISEFNRLMIVRPLMQSLFGGAGAGGAGGLAGGIGGFLKGLLGGGGGAGGGLRADLASMGVFANGGAFDRGIVPFAAGGVFDSPHLFKFAKGNAMATGVLGEAGPEAIMPLKRGPNGKLGVVASGGRGGAVTNYISVGAGVSRNEVQSLMQLYGESLKGEILQSMQNGGAFSMARGY
ncbi:phage tail tape measure protein [Aquincola sp. J276]|uniref:phage tail tape measure protein n=1 Tax=Aquincola sp. J276 TaxID=2898432 RepID=UPI002151621A|nr:phage tail tape measure C-terminal domain-containing protein [Aquincola sp. J276]MCR5864648.1 hypothetical protein [Aquincola sp. J276]